MKKDRKRSRIIVQAVVIVLLSVTAILFFLFSIKGLLFSEVKNRLEDTTKRGHKIVSSYDAQNVSSTSSKDVIMLDSCNASDILLPQNYSYILSLSGNVIAYFGDQAKEYAAQFDNDFTALKEKFTSSEIIDKIFNDGPQFIKIITDDMKVYVMVDKNVTLENGYLVTLIDQSQLDQEIDSIFNIGIIIIVIAIFGLLLAVLYNVYRQLKQAKIRDNYGKPDKITGLPSYTVHRAIAQKYINDEKFNYAYVTFSIDRYAFISELNGKEYCDYLLRGIADVVSNWIGENETFARCENDMFGMLLVYENELKFRQRLIRILKHAGDIPNNENNFCKLTFHSGVCLVGKETDVDRVINRSRKAKNASGIQSVANINIYQEKLESKKETSDLVKEVAEAMYEDRFLVYLQPKYQISHDKITGAEALVRWNHAKNGMISPSVFLPMLEENEIITQIDLHVLEKVCTNIIEWQKEKKEPVPVSINLSAQHLNNPLFIQEILQIVDNNHIPHNLIEFEFPENAVYEHHAELIEAVKQLDQLGFTISVDNFGAGHSTMHLLRELPIHVLKIDKGLIRDLDDIEFTDKDRTIVMHIISCAKELNMKVVAEGVETKEQRDMLLAQKCDMIQGYYYQKPMPPTEFIKLLESAE